MLRKLFTNLFGKKENSKEDMMMALMSNMSKQLEELQKENQALKESAITKDEPVSKLQYDEMGNIARDKEILEANDTKRDAIWNSAKQTNSKYDTMDYKDLKREHEEVIQSWIISLRSQIIAKGYEAIPEICEDFRTELLQDFVAIQSLQLGSYAPEFDNLDGLSREELIETIADLNLLQWEVRQIEQGRDIKPSKGQLDFIQKYEANWIPKTRAEASIMIKKIQKKYNLQPSSNEVSDRQKARLDKLVTLLEVSAKDYAPSNRKEASEMIAELQKEADEVLGKRPATEKQIEMYKQYLKLNNMKLTKGRKEALEGINQEQISALIKDLKDKYDTEHPEASKGQVDYIMTLCGLLNAPVNRADIELLTKEEATKKIDSLSRDRLYYLGVAKGCSYSKEDIKKMTRDEVKRLTDDLLDKSASMDIEER